MKMLTTTSTAPTIHAHAGIALFLSGIFYSSLPIPHLKTRIFVTVSALRKSATSRAMRSSEHPFFAPS
jgi:hypothetical protein